MTKKERKKWISVWDHSGELFGDRSPGGDTNGDISCPVAAGSGTGSSPKTPAGSSPVSGNDGGASGNRKSPKFRSRSVRPKSAGFAGSGSSHKANRTRNFRKKMQADGYVREEVRLPRAVVQYIASIVGKNQAYESKQVALASIIGGWVASARAKIDREEQV